MLFNTGDRQGAFCYSGAPLLAPVARISSNHRIYGHQCSGSGSLPARRAGGHNISTRPKPSTLGVWLAFHHECVACSCENGELGRFALELEDHQHTVMHGTWLPCFCFPCRAPLQQSMFTCHVLTATCVAPPTVNRPQPTSQQPVHSAHP